MQYEQNSTNVLKSKLFQFIFLLGVSSVDIYRYSYMIGDCVVYVDIRLAFGVVFKICRHIEREIV